MVERTLYQWPYSLVPIASQNNMTEFINNVQNNAENEIRSSLKDAKTKTVIHIP